MGPDAITLVFWMSSFKSALSLFSFPFIKRLYFLFTFCHWSVSSVYLRWLIFLPAILIPAYESSSPIFSIMFSAYKLNKQGDNIQPWCTPLPIWNWSVGPCPVLTVTSCTSCRFVMRQVRWFGTPISSRMFHSLLWPTQSKCIIALTYIFSEQNTFSDSHRSILWGLWPAFCTSICYPLPPLWAPTPGTKATLLPPAFMLGTLQFHSCVHPRFSALTMWNHKCTTLDFSFLKLLDVSSSCLTLEKWPKHCVATSVLPQENGKIHYYLTRYLPGLNYLVTV